MTKLSVSKVCASEGRLEDHQRKDADYDEAVGAGDANQLVCGCDTVGTLYSFGVEQLQHLGERLQAVV